jgi:hypothetical protein
MPDKIDVDRVKTIEELFQENGLPSPQKGYKKLLSSGAIGDIERSLTNLFQDPGQCGSPRRRTEPENRNNLCQ